MLPQQTQIDEMRRYNFNKSVNDDLLRNQEEEDEQLFNQEDDEQSSINNAEISEQTEIYEQKSKEMPGRIKKYERELPRLFGQLAAGSATIIGGSATIIGGIAAFLGGIPKFILILINFNKIVAGEKSTLHEARQLGIKVKPIRWPVTKRDILIGMLTAYPLMILMQVLFFVTIFLVQYYFCAVKMH